jgi:hypothetical protein
MASADATRRTHRLVVRILLLLFLGFGAVVAAVVLVIGSNFYRLDRYREQTRRALVITPSEADVRERFGAEVRARLLARDFAGLDLQAAELRRTRETFAGTSVPKLTQLYRALGDDRSRPEAEWTQTLDLMNEWVRERPESVTARLGAAEAMIAYAWDARGDGWADGVPEDRMVAFHQRLQQAHRLAQGADALAERCPRRGSVMLRLALGLSWSKAEEQRIYDEAVREFPDEQAYHNVHLVYLLPSWHGAPGEWQVAGQRILQLPDGHEKYAYAVWSTSLDSPAGRDVVSWPMLRRGFDQILVRHPDWFEARSVYLRFACIFAEKTTAQVLLRDLRHRRDASVWTDPEDLVNAYEWVEFEETEKAGGDPLATFFQRFLR